MRVSTRWIAARYAHGMPARRLGLGRSTRAASRRAWGVRISHFGEVVGERPSPGELRERGVGVDVRLHRGAHPGRHARDHLGDPLRVLRASARVRELLVRARAREQLGVAVGAAQLLSRPRHSVRGDGPRRAQVIQRARRPRRSGCQRGGCQRGGRICGTLRELAAAAAATARGERRHADDARGGERPS